MNYENKQERPIRGTLPLPDHSDLRGFSYRAPSNTQGYNDSPNKKGNLRLHGNLYHPRRAGFWTSIADFFRGRKPSEERPLNPEMVERVRERSNGPRLVRAVDIADATEALARAGRMARPKERDSAGPWPG